MQLVVSENPFSSTPRMVGWESIAREMEGYFPGATARNIKEHTEVMLKHFRAEDRDKLKK